ncbi:MAG: hypothetical protein NTW74_15130 [Acidobacteria bacterium]|nr:hypothetical protein [Acidobacteriota bacterium]
MPFSLIAYGRTYFLLGYPHEATILLVFAIVVLAIALYQQRKSVRSALLPVMKPEMTVRQTVATISECGVITGCSRLPLVVVELVKRSALQPGSSQ